MWTQKHIFYRSRSDACPKTDPTPHLFSFSLPCKFCYVGSLTPTNAFLLRYRIRLPPNSFGVWWFKCLNRKAISQKLSTFDVWIEFGLDFYGFVEKRADQLYTTLTRAVLAMYRPSVNLSRLERWWWTWCFCPIEFQGARWWLQYTFLGLSRSSCRKCDHWKGEHKMFNSRFMFVPANILVYTFGKRLNRTIFGIGFVLYILLASSMQIYVQIQ